ncbi:ATP-binding cassette domain-containing protein [Clostridium sediminicola]|uniref:ABC transporter ATP-binding protein n=1 Tax=Clostridium sediminicola TaxID=3114879 RepID=UPI0031F25538
MFQLKNLNYKINDGEEIRSILNDINFELEENKIYVITGPNGGGKSTLCKLMMGITKPTSGQIYFEGKDISNFDITERANLGIGYAFQQPAHFKGMKVRELLEIASRNNVSVSDVGELIADVGLCPKNYLDREVNGNLSGGELKRIEIATVLGRELKVAIFDEPEAGIDLWSFQKLVDTFLSYHKKFSTTIVIISHQERIIQMADEVIVMKDGTIARTTSKSQIISEIKSEAACDYCITCGERR